MILGFVQFYGEYNITETAGFNITFTKWKYHCAVGTISQKSPSRWIRTTEVKIMGRFSDLLLLSLPFFHLYKEDYEKYEAAIARRTTLTSMLVDDTPIRAKQRYWLSCLNLCRFKSTPLKRLCFRGALIYTPLLYLFLISFNFYSKLSFSTFFATQYDKFFINLRVQ